VGGWDNGSAFLRHVPLNTVADDRDAHKALGRYATRSRVRHTLVCGLKGSLPY
jgi:hypothetical protein